jgi:hypothetical protein
MRLATTKMTVQRTTFCDDNYNWPAFGYHNHSDYGADGDNDEEDKDEMGILLWLLLPLLWLCAY